ncbi:MAG: hypothetical protein ACOZCL_17000 [Bacillota bacterium]
MTRAVKAILLEENQRSLSAEEDLLRYEEQGFKNVHNIYKLIKYKYMPNRDIYKTFDSFVPVIFEHIRAYSLNEPFDME